MSEKQIRETTALRASVKSPRRPATRPLREVVRLPKEPAKGRRPLR
jgi:hypothetical protein